MRCAIAAAVAVLATAGAASAQGLVYKPIDTNQLVVQPTDAATGILSGTARYVSRVVAGVLDSNAYVQAFNSLFGRSTPTGATTQTGYSPLPAPGTYPSTQYKNSFTPAMPIYQTFGKTPGG